MKEIALNKVTTLPFNDFLLIVFSKNWVQVNDGNPIEFDAKLIEGQLVLSAKLARLERTNEVVKNEIKVITEKC